MYDVAHILQRSRPAVRQSDAAFVTKLQRGQLYNRHEQMWLTKVLARHLMENCEKKLFLYALYLLVTFTVGLHISIAI